MENGRLTPTDRYAAILDLAAKFAPVVEAVEDHPVLPGPDGMSGSKMTWRKTVGSTTYLGWIMRIAAESECVIFTVAYVTPDTHAALRLHGTQIHDAQTVDTADAQAVAVQVHTFAEVWHACTADVHGKAP